MPVFPRSIPVFGLIVLTMFAATLLAPAYGQDIVLDFLIVGNLQSWVNHLGDAEPGIDVTLVPGRAFFAGLSDEQLYRQIRIYFPRNMNSLLDYEVLLINAPRLDLFTGQQQKMMVDFVGARDKVSFGYPLSTHAEVQDPWLASPLSKAFPVDYDRYVAESRASGFAEWWENRPLRVVSDLPPVFTVFEETGIFDDRIYRTCRPCYAKEGATIWIYMIEGPPGDPEEPAFISWPYEGTDTWSFGVHPGYDRPQWQLAGDWWELIFLNVCFYTLEWETFSLDEAVNARHVKVQLSHFQDFASMFQSISDFVSRVGANTNQAQSTLREGFAVRDQAEAYYLEQRYDEARDMMEEALGLANQAMDEAKDAKDSALLWIYVIEWMATTATALMSGVVVWWLMIRRRLYREVTVTRLSDR